MNEKAIITLKNVIDIFSKEKLIEKFEADLKKYSKSVHFSIFMEFSLSNPFDFFDIPSSLDKVSLEEIYFLSHLVYARIIFEVSNDFPLIKPESFWKLNLNNSSSNFRRIHRSQMSD